MKKLLLSICSVLCLIILAIFSTIPNYVVAENSSFDVNVKSACLIDFSTATVLYEKNADEKLPIASMVKLMTILLTLENIDSGNLSLSEKLVTSENASGMGGSQVFIDPYVEYSIEDMLKSIIMASANDASVAMAEKIAGSEDNFVAKMNNRAKELGMKNTLYANSTGLPAPNHYSTARDISILNKELLKHSLYFKYSTIWMDKLVHPSGRETELVNTNRLIRYYKGCDSGKTGSTDEAGYCLSASAERDNLRVIATVMSAKDSTTRFNETSKLFNFAFANYENKDILKSDVKLVDLPLLKSKLDSVEIFAKENYKGLVKKGEKSNFEVKLDVPKNLKAPINKGQSIGKVLIIKDGQIIAEIDAVSNTYATTYSFKEAFNKVVNNWKIS